MLEHTDIPEQQLVRQARDDATVRLNLPDDVFLRSSTRERWQLGISAADELRRRSSRITKTGWRTPVQRTS
jgi:hypothetical protein